MSSTLAASLPDPSPSVSAASTTTSGSMVSVAWGATVTSPVSRYGDPLAVQRASTLMLPMTSVAWAVAGAAHSANAVAAARRVEGLKEDGERMISGP